MRLIEHLRAIGVPKANQALKTGKVKVRGVPTSDGGREVEPQEVTYDPRAHRLQPGRDLAVIFHDKHLAAVWKPSGLLSTAAPKRGRDDNLVTACARIFGAAHPVHRLDEGTSGLMLVALTPIAQTSLKKLFEDHAIRRGYLALVHGHFSKKDQTRTSVLGRGPDGRRASVDSSEGRSATTHLQGLDDLPRGLSLVGARLETGRTHQVRIHLAEAGYPVVGDDLYGRRRDHFKRLALHASVLEFKHPLTGRKLHFDAGLPDDMERYRRHLLAEGPMDGPAPRKKAPRPKKSKKSKKK